jgi:Ala-tRNA(Pro) deacylase
MRNGPEDLFRMLDRLGITATVHRHPPVFTVEESRSLRGSIPGVHTKNLFLRDKKGSYFLFSAEEEQSVDLKRLRSTLGARGTLSFGSAEALLALLGIAPGVVSPLAVINDTARLVRVALHRRIFEANLVNVHPLTNEMTVSMAPAALVRFLNSVDHAPLIVDDGSEPSPDQPVRLR